MKLVIPKDLSFRYENESAIKDILAIANKYNWDENEKLQLMTIVSKCRRAGYIKCYNFFTANLKENQLINEVEDLTKQYHGKGMSDALLRAFSIGCEVNIYKDLHMCYIELTHKKSMNQRGQYLPLDDHLDRAIPGCIDICVKELLKDIDQKVIDTPK